MKAVFRKGIYWAVLNGVRSVQKGTRPVLVISNDKGNYNSSIVTVVPITTRVKKPLPTHVRMPGKGVCKGIILCEQIVTISQSQLRDYITEADEALMCKVHKAIVIALNMGERYPKHTYTRKEEKRSLNQI